jgi:hypothetical protein
MRIEIEASPPGPLRIIKVIPSSRLAMLEGLNGIGKTLAVRLLQLCTGEMPYRTDAPAWRSLCLGLGHFTVTATGLAQAGTIRWEADSHDWEAHTPPEGPVAFSRIEIGGRPGSIDEVRQYLQVHRLAGDEDLVETLAQRADDAADAVRRWSRRFAHVESSPLATLEARLNEVVGLLGDWSGGRYAQFVGAVRETDLERRRRAAVAETTRARRDVVQEARRVQHQLRQLEADLPSIQAELNAVESEIEGLRADRDETHSAITTLAGRVAAAAPVALELRNARRTLDRNRDNLSTALDSLAVAATRAEVEPDATAVSAASRTVESELSALTAEQTRLDQAPAMRGLLDETTSALGRAEDDGLGDQVMIEDPETDLQLTVAETKTGMATRRLQLEGQPPIPEAEDVFERIQQGTRRLELLRHAETNAAEAGRYRRLVDENQRRVDAALQAFDPSAVQRLQELETRRRASDESMLQLASRRAALRQQLGGLLSADSAEQAAQLLNDALAELGLEPSQLDEALVVAEQQVADAAAAQRETDEAHRTARRDLARADADVRRAASALSASEGLSWLRASLPSAATSVPSDPPDQQAAAIGAARSLVDDVVDRLGDHRGQLGAVEVALRGLARRLRGQSLETRRFVEQLEAWLGQHFSEWFNNERVRAELLPEADGLVLVDLHTAEVRWHEGTAERSRPLEAFSSGEQAFAYTRARLAILDEQDNPPANRLIVLDEFGAFIAHDRLTGLLAHLRDRAEQHLNDQVLVVLPLSRDYSAMAATAFGDEATRYGVLAAEIADHNYALQEIVP